MRATRLWAGERPGRLLVRTVSLAVSTVIFCGVSEGTSLQVVARCSVVLGPVPDAPTARTRARYSVNLCSSASSSSDPLVLKVRSSPPPADCQPAGAVSTQGGGTRTVLTGGAGGSLTNQPLTTSLATAHLHR